MKPYTLTNEAENDLREVARYTLNKWGRDKLHEYRSGLKQAFEAIGKNRIAQHRFSNQFPQLLVTKYKYHFIFYLTEGFEGPVIIGVIHEKRDLVNRLTERLS